MEPTLRVGDHILVTPYHGGSPSRGDVIVFRSPANRDDLFVKRVVAGPGDLIELRAGRLFVGGHAVSEPYLSNQATTGVIASQIVPPGYYFVMGDNRPNSFDSRQWGFLSSRALIGHARFVLWSSGSGSMEPRAHATSVMGTTLRAPSIHLHRLFKTIE
jgi:signal peptidase I